MLTSIESDLPRNEIPLSDDTMYLKEGLIEHNLSQIGYSEFEVKF